MYNFYINNLDVFRSPPFTEGSINKNSNADLDIKLYGLLKFIFRCTNFSMHKTGHHRGQSTFIFFEILVWHLNVLIDFNQECIEKECVAT